MKKSFGLFLLVTVLIVSLVTGGCAPSQPAQAADSGDKVELKFLQKWPQPQNMAYFEEVVAEFEKANPNVKITMEAVADEPIKDKLRVLMGTDSQPDIYFSWSGEFAKKFVRSNNALDLTDALKADTAWSGGIMKAGLEPFTFEGKTYGIPFRINGKFFVYNKEMFDKFGLKEPKTWDEFMALCETLKKGGVTPIAFGDISPWAACHYLTGLNQKMVAQDVRLKDYEPKTGEFTDPGYVKALQLLKDMNDKGYFNEGVNSIEHNMAIETFAQGNQAMLYVELEEFKDINDKMTGKPWGFFAMPEITEGQGNKNYLTGAPDGFMISAKTKHPEEAVAFLKFLSSKANGEKLVKMLGWPSPVIGAVNDSNAPEALVKGMQAIESADGMALWLDTDINIKISDTYLAGMQEIFNETKTPEQVMKEVQAAAKAVAQETQ